MTLSKGERCHVAAATYEIRIKGRVSDSLLPAFEGMEVTTEPVETIVFARSPTRRPSTGC
jgi:hypothetical protein